MSRVEVAIVGAGVVGLAVARELGARGADVCVFEREGVGAGASGVQPGGVRLQWGTRVACRLALESMTFWRDATERLDSPVQLELERCGYLFVARTAQTLDRLADNVRLQHEEGIPSEIVGAADAAELVPDLRSDAIAGGAWCGEDGYFDRPQSVVEAFARGVDVRHAIVVGIRPAATGGFELELADGERAAAGAVVVAAGVATAELLRPLGVELPIVPEDRYLFYSAPIAERLLEPLVVAPEWSFATKQLADGRVLASDLGARGDESAKGSWRETIRVGVDELLPRLTFVSYPLLVRGVYDVTPDHQPVLGPVPGHDGLHVAAGFSGHGFMISPAVGRIVADAVTGARDEVLDVLGAQRFETGALVPEPQLV